MPSLTPRAGPNDRAPSASTSKSPSVSRPDVLLHSDEDTDDDLPSNARAALNDSDDDDDDGPRMRMVDGGSTLIGPQLPSSSASSSDLAAASKPTPPPSLFLPSVPPSIIDATPRPIPVLAQAQLLDELNAARTFKLGEIWYVVSARWLASLRKGEAGPIDNSDLAQPAPNPFRQLKLSLQERVHYECVAADVFGLMVDWYGLAHAAHVFPRQCVAYGMYGSPSLELYPKMLTIEFIDINTGLTIANNPLLTHAGYKAIAFSPATNDAAVVIPVSMFSCLNELLSEFRPLVEAQYPELKAEAELKSTSATSRFWEKESAAKPLLTGRIWMDRPKDFRDDIKDNYPLVVERYKAEMAAGTFTDVQVFFESEMDLRFDSFALVPQGAHLLIEFKPTARVSWARAGGRGLEHWMKCEVGDVIDAKDTDGKWYESVITEVSGTRDSMRVHYIGWAPRWDATVHLPSVHADIEARQRCANCVKLAPKNTFSRGLFKQNPSRNQVISSDLDWLEGGRSSSVRGLSGIKNCGNTCFMSSILQCMLQAPSLIEYFFTGRYQQDINRDNPLGNKGRVADEFGALVAAIWSGKHRVFNPMKLKNTIGEFQPRFSSFSQQDSSEFLSFLLDGLHEDLNLVLKKPFVPTVEANGRPDDIVARESWEGHLKRNQSKIVDTSLGQLRSQVTCPACNRQSVTFDPYMFLSVPIPVDLASLPTPLKLLEITVILTRQTCVKRNLELGPRVVFVRVPRDGLVADVKREICKMFDLPPETTPSQFFRTQHKVMQIVYTDSHAVASLHDSLVYVEMPYTMDQYPALPPNAPVENDEGNTFSCWIHFYRRTPRTTVGSTGVWGTQNMYASLPSPDGGSSSLGPNDYTYTEEFTPLAFQIRLGYWGKNMPVSMMRERVRMLVEPFVRGGWEEGEDESQYYDILFLDTKSVTVCYEPLKTPDEPVSFYAHGQFVIGVVLKDGVVFECVPPAAPAAGEPQVQPPPLPQWKEIAGSRLTYSLQQKSDFKSELVKMREYEAMIAEKNKFSIDACIEAYCKEETLGESETWYCSACKQHQQARKKIDLWNTPDILIIHLKRFIFTSTQRQKLDVPVSFPLTGLDMSKFLASRQQSTDEEKAAFRARDNTYDLFAVSNHMGFLSGGHYTASCRSIVDGNWYKMDDSSVTPMKSDDVFTRDAYVLFYCRRSVLQATQNARDASRVVPPPAALLAAAASADEGNASPDSASWVNVKPEDIAGSA